MALIDELVILNVLGLEMILLNGELGIDDVDGFEIECRAIFLIAEFNTVDL